MTKTQRIRDALATLAPSEIMPAGHLQEKTGIDSLAVAIHSMLKSGEVIATGKRGEKCYRLNPKHSHKSSLDKALPVKRRKKTVRKNRRPSRPSKSIKTSLVAIAGITPVFRLVVGQLIAASRLLRTTVSTNVEGLENDRLLTGALQNAERAEAIMEAIEIASFKDLE